MPWREINWLRCSAASLQFRARARIMPSDRSISSLRASGMLAMRKAACCGGMT